MIIAAIPVEWAIFFTLCLGLGALFFVVRAVVFKAANRLANKIES